jgi:4'-phosphopantetheinyl transferase
VPDSDVCWVFWGDRIDLGRRRDLLDRTESTRGDRMMHPEARTRQIAGAALLRLAAGRLASVDPTTIRVDRRCGECRQPHGRPRLVGLDLHASVSHSGDRVTVALTRAGPVGIDVERISPFELGDVASDVLAPCERATSTRDFLTYWVRKESVVKATGDGIVAALERVRVSRPSEPALLLGYPGRSSMAATMTDLNPGEDYVAAVTVLTPRAITVTEQPWTSLVD